MFQTFTSDNFNALCDRLAAVDSDLKEVIGRSGYPPIWMRPNTFETLTHIILEQQVSLASARAALGKLKSRLGDITPRALLELTDEEMKACFVSRQKS